MKVQYFGKPSKRIGKTLWQIVGNLKNFGVGRLVTKYDGINIYPEPCYFKIVKVQAVPPDFKDYIARNVIVWIEEVYRGRKLEIRETLEQNNSYQFQLVPKHEEKYLLNAKFDENASKLFMGKHTEWPPLYKRLWEQRQLMSENIAKPIPKLVTVLPKDCKSEVIFKEDTYEKPISSSFVPTKGSVLNTIKEIIELKKTINRHSLEKIK